MHPIATARHWGHDVHDGFVTVWHHIDQHLHSRHFWIGVGITLLVLGMITLIAMIAMFAPAESTGGFPIGTPYYPYGM